MLLKMVLMLYIKFVILNFIFIILLITEISDEVYKNKAGNYSNNVAKQKTKTKLHLNHKNTITNDFSLNLCDISKLPSPLFYNYNSNIKILLTNQLHINRDGYVLLLL